MKEVKFSMNETTTSRYLFNLIRAYFRMTKNVMRNKNAMMYLFPNGKGAMRNN